ncbi:hypothetical protein Pst134EA_011562 [Puccinia striiformis f. sp. tritici]|uniref:hypothetical protein n=2 Tax=Puccinia striiformis f. sp. tritici TaxID=168172 RepID=UPI0020083E36|nr:hypothetical protein Pst134EA_011562 [Puccinia striiformis f. sp. tritici]KAH9467941.1 hypothetical protein Pst134EA_011562 [Puccinia striiformis f. sp. tritici]
MVGLGSNITAGFAGGRNFRAADSTINTASAADSTLNTAQNPHSSASYNSTTPSPATSNHNDTNLDLNLPCDDGPDGLHAAMSANVDGVADNPKHKYSDAEMEQYATTKLTSLCAAGNSLAISRRMTQEMKQDLDDLYYNQQCDVVRLAIRNRVAPHLFFSHLGINRRMRGDSSWNNFQHEDPEAQRLRAKFGKQEGGEKVSLAWASKSDAEKARYRDRDYLQSLRQGSSDSPHASDPVDDLNANALYEKEMAADRQKGLVQASKLDSMAFHNQIEGFFVVASRHPKSTIFRKGGSSFGSGFMDMVAETTDADFAAEFHTWVAAQAIQISKGCTAWLPRKSRIKPSGDERDEFNVGTKGKNVTAIRVKLKNMISIATGKKVSCGWPGENTETRLRELKLSLEIDTNKWSVEPKDFMQPLDYLKDGVDRAILACLGLNKVHLTYHSEWDDVPTARKKSTKRKDGERDPDNSANVQEEQGSDATGPHDRNAASTGHNSSNTNNEEEAQAHHDNNHRPAKRARVGAPAKRKHVRKDHPAKTQRRSANRIEPSVDRNIQAASSREAGSADPTRGGEPSTAANGGSPLRPEVLDPMLDLLR